MRIEKSSSRACRNTLGGSLLVLWYFGEVVEHGVGMEKKGIRKP